MRITRVAYPDRISTRPERNEFQMIPLKIRSSRVQKPTRVENVRVGPRIWVTPESVGVYHQSITRDPLGMKCKGWVTKFTAACGNESSFGRDDSNWSYGSTSAGQIFVLLSDLTDIGWEKRYELVACICQYISLLRPSGSLIEEYAQSLRMKYHALEYDHVDELSFAQVLAVNMLKAPATSALSLDYVYDFGDQAGFEEILKKLGPQNMRVDCLTKLFKDKDCQTVPYFQARYKVEAMPDLICPDDSSLCLPSPNEFMPSRFFSEIKRVSLLEEADDTTKFDICLDEVSRKLFYRKEESAFLSSASFNLYTNCGNDITAHMKTLVIIEMIKDDLSAILFKGGEVFINFSLTFEDNNILELRFDGFDERFKDFVSAIWKRMKSFIPNEKCFNREFTSSDIVKQAYQLLSNVLLEDNISLDEKFKVLNSISFSDVEDFNFASEIRIVGVCSGNLSEEESKEILSIFEATGTFEIPNEQATKKVLNPGVPLQINKKPKTESETNSLTKVFFQMSCKEEDSGRESAFLVILKATIDMFLYRELRQKERLGYEINCGIHLAPGMRGFFVYVVSPIYQPAFLLERIYNFFGTFVEFLEGFDKECFQTYIRRAYNFLPEDSGIHHGLIHDVKYIDGRSKSVIKSMRKMKKDDFIRLYKNFFTKETCCSINICISAGGASDQARCNSGSYTPNGSGGKYQNHKEEAAGQASL